MTPAWGAERGCKRLAVGRRGGRGPELQTPRDRAQVRASDLMTPARPRSPATAPHSQCRPHPCRRRRVDRAAGAEPPLLLPVFSPTPILSGSSGLAFYKLRGELPAPESKREVSERGMSTLKGQRSALAYNQAQPQDARGPKRASSSAVTSRPSPRVYFTLTHKGVCAEAVYFVCNHLCVLCDQPAEFIRTKH